MRAARLLRLQRGGDPYPVFLGRGLSRNLGPRLRRLWPQGRVAVITHRRLDRLYGDLIRRALRQAGLSAASLFFPEGERAKNLDTVRRLYTELLRFGLGREDGLVALGGGVVGDTAGFVAATYLRGISYVQVPTSLLAQIDSALGAKVGVNHPLGKNLIGAFHRPSAVFIDPALLASLPAREFRSGLFELLKYGFIGAPALFREMEKTPGGFRPKAARLDRAIATAVRLKLDVVRSDEKESGRRRILNFGHTIGHGLEAAGKYRYLTHGEAVGWGMIAAVRLAARRRLIGSRLAERMEAAVRGVGPLPSLRRLRVETIMKAIRKDKKIGPKGIRFVLPVGLGRVEVAEAMSEEEIRWALTGLRLGKR